MAKYLIIAHGDDEILWFNPEEYDKIIIVFSGREDRPDFKEYREKANAEHPLKPILWGLTESNFWRDSTKYYEHQKNYADICNRVAELKDATSITTHNANGEYGHADHILVHNAVMDSASCPVNGKDPYLYRQIKNIYTKNKCWTWN